MIFIQSFLYNDFYTISRALELLQAMQQENGEGLD
jgi:hypothetical protein